jgi:hypothetical protein
VQAFLSQEDIWIFCGVDNILPAQGHASVWYLHLDDPDQPVFLIPGDAHDPDDENARIKVDSNADFAFTAPGVGSDYKVIVLTKRADKPSIVATANTRGIFHGDSVEDLADNILSLTILHEYFHLPDEVNADSGTLGKRSCV